MDCAEIWCAVRDQLAMHFTLLGWGASARAHPFSVSRVNSWTDCAEIWYAVRNQLARQLMQSNSGTHLHVHTCVPLFCISGVAGRIVQKFAVWVERFTSYECYESHGWGTNNCMCPISGFTGELC